jgi:hypothetical protein
VQLTPHFSDTELGVAGAEQRLIDNALYLCRQLLEPIRARFGPVHVHDGYRNPEENAAVGGKLTSYHEFNGTESAADIDALPTDYQAVFDWIRLDSGLPFDKVILEKNAAGYPACIHLQIDSAVPPRRLAYTGSTGAGKVYTPVGVS